MVYEGLNRSKTLIYDTPSGREEDEHLFAVVACNGDCLRCGGSRVRLDSDPCDSTVSAAGCHSASNGSVGA
jgi:hypothetical protein